MSTASASNAGAKATPSGATLSIADTSAQDVVLAKEPVWRRRWPMLVGTVAVLLLIAFLTPSISGWLSTEDSVARDRLRLATVTRQDLIRDVSVQGRVVAAVSPTLYASQQGTITFLVNAGDRVTTDTQLATLDSPELTNLYAREASLLDRRRVDLERQSIQAKQENLNNQKAVDLAKLQLTAAERESRRADEAYSKEAISQLDFEKAKDDLEQARYTHTHAVADAELAKERLAFELRTKQLEVDQQQLTVDDLKRQVAELTLRSPVAGVVGNLLVDQKTSVQRNQAVLSVVDLSQFEVEAQIPESYADDLAIGMAGEIRNGQDRFAAELISISPEIIANQVTARLRFTQGSPPGLRQNQRLTTRVLLEEKTDVLTVPRGQFLDSGSGRLAYVVQDNIATQRRIEVGARSLNAVEITGGLEAGDTIIISSTELFRGAQTILITD
ncbi:MAG: HlyD family efflux transporter periplasmic adaptor subunit [Pseudomonadota bacterium]